jgi:hypothetical protein
VTTNQTKLTFQVWRGGNVLPRCSGEDHMSFMSEIDVLDGGGSSRQRQLLQR